MYSNEDARKMLEQGAALVLLNAPKMEFGIDGTVWQIGPKFKGLKMIPPGIHLVHFKYNDINAEGFLVNLESKQIVCRQWDPLNEEWTRVENEEAYSDLYALDEFLGPYPLESYGRWKKMSMNITEINICPLIFTSMTGSHYTLPTTDSSSFKFTRINLKNSFDPSSTGQLRTKYAIDKSLLIFPTILSELSISFCIFLFILNFDAFEHWKQLMKVLCCSFEAMDTDLYKKFVDLVLVQLEMLANELDDQMDWVYSLLSNVYREFSDSEKTLKLKRICLKRGWDIAIHDDDLPTIA